MPSRFSSDYAVDPKARGFETAPYIEFYPDDFLARVFSNANMQETNLETAREVVIRACSQYELLKYNILEHQSSPSHERDAQEEFYKKAEAFIKAYEDLRKAGQALPMMIINYQEHLAVKELTVKMPNIEDIQILSEIAKAAFINKKALYNRKNKSHLYLRWVENLATIFNEEPTVGNFYTSRLEPNSMKVLRELLTRIEPLVTDQQIAEAIKQFKLKKKKNNG